MRLPSVSRSSRCAAGCSSGRPRGVIGRSRSVPWRKRPPRWYGTTSTSVRSGTTPEPPGARLLLALCDHLAEGPGCGEPRSAWHENSRSTVCPLRRDSELDGDVAELRELEMLGLRRLVPRRDLSAVGAVDGEMAADERGLQSPCGACETGGGGPVVTVNPYQILGSMIPLMLGRAALVQRIENHLSKPTPDHVSVVGPKHYGKSVLCCATLQTSTARDRAAT